MDKSKHILIAIILLLNCIMMVHSERIGITGMVGNSEELNLSNDAVQEEIKPIVQFATNNLSQLKIYRDGSFQIMNVLKETLHHTFDGKSYLKSIRNNDKLVMGYYYHIVQKGMTLVNDKRKNYIFNVTVWKDLDKRLNMVKNTHYPSTPQKTAGNKSLKIMTYNIWNLNPVWKDRLAKITDEVLRFKPDIVAFQEVRYKFLNDWGERGSFQVEEIAEKLGKSYQYFYHHSMTYLDRQFFHEDEGHAIFSLHPIRETDYLRLSRDLEDREDDHQRLVARILVDSPIGPVYMHSSHLSLSENSRKRTSVEIWKYLESSYQKNQYPQIFVGDMNGEPNDVFYRFITGAKTLDNVKGNMLDAWSYLHPDEDGLTFPTNNPIKRIDFVFYRGITALTAKLAGKIAPASEWASDHLPLIVTFDKD